MFILECSISFCSYMSINLEKKVLEKLTNKRTASVCKLKFGALIVKHMVWCKVVMSCV